MPGSKKSVLDILDEQKDRHFYDFVPRKECTIRQICAKKDYTVCSMSFPSPITTPFPENNTVFGNLYRCPQSRHAVLVVHGLEGELPARYFSTYLARQGFCSYQITMPYSKKRVPRKKRKYLTNQDVDFSEVFPIGFQQSVSDIRNAAVLLRQHYCKIGILGMSMGAITASVAAEIDGGFDSAVYILGGADPANILWDSKNILVRFYKKVLQRNVSRAMLQKKWRLIDPAHYARGKAENILMINAQFDHTILPQYSIRLWEALGKPPIRWLKATHFTSSFFLPYLRREAARHFQKTLQ